MRRYSWWSCLNGVGLKLEGKSKENYIILMSDSVEMYD